MLDRADRNPIAIGKAGAKMRIADQIVTGRDRLGSGIRVDAMEYDSRVCCRGRHRQSHRLPVVQTDTPELHRIHNCAAHCPARLWSCQRAVLLKMDKPYFI